MTDTLTGFLLITGLGGALRCFLVRRATTVWDTYAHLYLLQEVRAQRAGPFGAVVPRVVGAGSFRAPFLWHWLLGLLPVSVEKILRYQRWINALLDAAFAGLIYALAIAAEFAEYTAAIISLLYLLTPMWFSGLATGLRVNGLTPRLASEVATNLFFVVTLIPFGLPGGATVAIATLLAAFVILSSKFGLQAMLFLVPPTSVLVRDATPMAALSLGFLLAVAVTRGQFFLTISEQLHHLVWFFKGNLKGSISCSRQKGFSGFWTRPPEKLLRVHLADVLLRCVAFNSWTSTLIKMPVFVCAWACYVMTPEGANDVVPRTIVGPVIAATGIYLLISLPPLLFLGEPERYLNHVAFFIVTMCVIAAPPAGAQWLLAGLLIYGGFFWMGECCVVPQLRPTRFLSVEADRRVIAHLKSLPKPMVVLSYPYDAVGVYRILLETPHTVIFPLIASKGFRDSFENRFAADFPHVRLDCLDEMARELDIRVTVVARKALAYRGLRDWVASSEWRAFDVGAPVYDVYHLVANTPDESVSASGLEHTLSVAAQHAKTVNHCWSVPDGSPNL